MRPEDIAFKLKYLLIEVSPLIEELTQKICPQCNDVCCRQKHVIPEEKDRIYLKITGAEYSVEDRDPEGLCQFLGERGCVRPRWQRPLRCTWYFCDSLLKEMDERDQRKVRRLIEIIQEIVKLSGMLVFKKDSPGP